MNKQFPPFSIHFLGECDAYSQPNIDAGSPHLAKLPGRIRRTA